VKIALRVAATLLASGVGFVAAAFITGVILDRWYVPKWIEQNPHDGQIGLAVFVRSLDVGCAVAFAILLLGLYLTFRPKALLERSIREQPRP
jgi:hypothetical protein